jgi:hypothetical protein
VPVPDERIIAVGLLTQRDVRLLGPTFDRLWPVEDAPHFDELLAAIDEAEEQLHRTKSASGHK